MKNGFLGIVFAAALCSFGTQASADIFTITYAGTLASGSDVDNTWGTGFNADLAGDAFQLVFNVNTAGSFHTSLNDPGLHAFDTYEGGTFYGASPPVTALMTINGHSEESSGAIQSIVGNEQIYPAYVGFARSTTNEVSEDSTSNIQILVTSNKSTTFPIPVTASFSIPTIDGTNIQIQGSFAFFDADPIDTSGTFSLTGVSVLSLNSAIPEPSTWAMMLLGFAGLGFAGYRASRRKGVAAA